MVRKLGELSLNSPTEYDKITHFLYNVDIRAHMKTCHWCEFWKSCQSCRCWQKLIGTVLICIRHLKLYDSADRVKNQFNWYIPIYWMYFRHYIDKRILTEFSNISNSALPDIIFVNRYYWHIRLQYFSWK